LSRVLLELADRLEAIKLDGRAALRTTTPDHLPMIGPAPDYDAYLSAYHDIDKGKKAARYIDAPYHKDVYICTGFGARGLIAAPLAAEIIASEICNMPLPLEKSLMDAIHPARFIVRGLKRRQITA
jgi:tRNA 5-methylaminomethyl-2-thiouridine biosynthesis bifunctional protein